MAEALIAKERAACRLILRDAHSTADSIGVITKRPTCEQVLP